MPRSDSGCGGSKRGSPPRPPRSRPPGSLRVREMRQRGGAGSMADSTMHRNPRRPGSNPQAAQTHPRVNRRGASSNEWASDASSTRFGCATESRRMSRGVDPRAELRGPTRRVVVPWLPVVRRRPPGRREAVSDASRSDPCCRSGSCREGRADSESRRHASHADGRARDPQFDRGGDDLLRREVDDREVGEALSRVPAQSPTSDKCAVGPLRGSAAGSS